MHKSNLTDDELGAVAYETYCTAVGGKAFNGDPLLPWKALVADPYKAKLVTAWKCSARAVAILVELKQPVVASGDAPLTVTGAHSSSSLAISSGDI